MPDHIGPGGSGNPFWSVEPPDQNSGPSELTPQQNSALENFVQFGNHTMGGVEQFATQSGISQQAILARLDQHYGSQPPPATVAPLHTVYGQDNLSQSGPGAPSLMPQQQAPPAQSNLSQSSQSAYDPFGPGPFGNTMRFFQQQQLNQQPNPQNTAGPLQQSVYGHPRGQSSQGSGYQGYGYPQSQSSQASQHRNPPPGPQPGDRHISPHGTEYKIDKALSGKDPETGEEVQGGYSKERDRFYLTSHPSGGFQLPGRGDPLPDDTKQGLRELLRLGINQQDASQALDRGQNYLAGFKRKHAKDLPKKGISDMTREDHKAMSKRGGIAAQAKLTPEQRKANAAKVPYAKRQQMAQTMNEQLTSQQRSNAAHARWDGMNAQQRSDAARQAAINRWARATPERRNTWVNALARGRQAASAARTAANPNPPIQDLNINPEELAELLDALQQQVHAGIMQGHGPADIAQQLGLPEDLIRLFLPPGPSESA